MHRRPLGTTGLDISAVAFGAGPVPGLLTAAGAKDVQQATVRAALDAGINWFDTADSYAGGESETLLGRALGARRGEVLLSTKVGFRTGEPLGQQGLSRRHILWSIDQSLKRLGRRQEARTHLRMACALSPESSLFRDALARLGPPPEQAE